MKDDLRADIEKIVTETTGHPEDHQELILKLLIYIVERDGKVLIHGYKEGMLYVQK